MLGSYENFPETIHGKACFAVSLPNKRLQQTVITTLQKLNVKTCSVESITSPSIPQCAVSFEFGIAEGQDFNYVDDEEKIRMLQAVRKKAFLTMDFLCALRYHKTNEGKEKTPLRFDYYVIRLTFGEGSMEARVFHERGPRHLEPEDLIHLIADEINQACRKKALRILGSV